MNRTLKDENSPGEIDGVFFWRCALHQLGEDGKVGITQCHRLLIKGSEAGKRTKWNKTQAFCLVLGDNTDTYNFSDFFFRKTDCDGKTSIHSFSGEVLQPKMFPNKNFQENPHTPHGQKTKSDVHPENYLDISNIHKLQEGKDFFSGQTSIPPLRQHGVDVVSKVGPELARLDVTGRLFGHHFFLGGGAVEKCWTSAFKC